MRLAIMLCALLSFMGSGLSRTALAQKTPEEMAQKSDISWLALTDAGKYAESWKEASAAFQAGVTEAKWESAAQAVRSPLGKVETRKLKDAVFTRTLPGAPDGEYVVAHFDTSFEHKQAAVETVVSSLEKDGSWRVTGYFVR